MSKIFELKLIIKEGSKLCDRDWIITSKENIINIDQKGNKSGACSLGKKRVVTLRLDKTMLKKSGREFGEPLSGGLFQAIQGLNEPANWFMKLTVPFVTRRQSHENLFI